MGNHNEFLDFFITEAFDTLQEWEKVCLNLRKDKDQQYILQLFRLAHNLKGASRSLGLEGLSTFIHQIEDGITFIRDNNALEDHNIDLFLNAQTLLMEWFTQLQSDANFELNLAEKDKQEFLDSLSQLLNQNNSKVIEQETRIENAININEPVDCEHQVFSPQKNDSTVNTTVNVSVNESSLNEKQNSSSNITANAKVSSPRAQNDSIRVASTKLDALLQSLGELSIQQSIIWSAKESGDLYSEHVLKSIDMCNKLFREAHETALSLRMQTVQSLFQRLERTALEAAKNLQKKIKVEFVGEDTELDKIVIEKITDALTHMIRNSVDHGVETPEQRETTKKPKIATIKLSATKEPSGVKIQLTDDGRGLSLNKILQKAVQKKIIAENQKLNKVEIMNLIFQPGFSTAEIVTDISGRGVGMDVVKKTIESLKGQVEIQSEEGQGTIFDINLPTSLSIIDALVVLLNGEKYVVPIDHIDEILDIKTYELMHTENKTIRVRGSIIPFDFLNNYLISDKNNINKEIKSDTAISTPALVIKQGQYRVAFCIDAIFNQQQVVVRPLSEQLKTIPAFAGATILSNGEPSFIIDVQMIIKNYLNKVLPKELVA